jgi:DNA repair protein RadA/Sms
MVSTMGKVQTIFRCQDCGGAASRWAGRCPACGEWNTIVEERATPAAATLAPPATAATPIDAIAVDEFHVRPTGIGELDRVLAGGLVPGSVTLLGGEPGIGKSTLLLQLAAARARRGDAVLYVSAEESRPQVRLRAERLDALVPAVLLAADTSLPEILGHLDAVRPALVIVDSIQTVHDPQLTSAPGSVAQVRECAHALVQEAKRRGVAMVLAGHVTKDGNLAGPRVLEHVVDTVLSFEGDRHHALRMLRAVKHRFGSTSELGLFEMTDGGLVGVPDASGLFLADRHPGVPGSVVVPTLDGHRPLLVEVQALVESSGLALPRRSAQGLDAGRLPLLLAVLGKHAATNTSKHDVYALAVGGVRVVEPGADLAIALAVTSSTRDLAIPEDLVACGEIGLGGELRQVAQMSRRLAEAARLGFTRAIVPQSAPEPPPGMRLIRVSSVADAIRHAGLVAQVVAA